MKYNSKYERWVTKGGLVYRYDPKKDRLVQCKLSTSFKRLFDSRCVKT